MPHEVRADMGAIVFRVVAHKGTAVSPGDDLLILESMKIEIPVTAELGGVISDVMVNEGDTVQEGDTLLIIE